MDEPLELAMGELDEEKVLALVEERIQAGVSPTEIVESCRNGVEIVGRRYSDGVYFLSDLIMSEEIFRGVMRLVEPHIPQGEATNGYTVVMGTIEGDIHDLGKNIIIYLLRSSGFRVYDLGVDVSPERFVQAVSETKTCILGISVLLSFCVGSIKKVVDLLEEAGLRDEVKVVVGGYTVSELVREYTGVDYYAGDVSQALRIIREIVNADCPQRKN
ncbi:Cobalamin (vitamin B12)-binding domain protein [Acididesulfobacillus acetoxydans]|uniref:Cobalamin (Vitamin B12)-binding domain protein n=1 Tax=Acididesulfobacillus acetoxydans TaxID=1561005 RepID=A0A8S0Y2G5_9FIRM|nr:cobalamin-dependent protein [Acididesulfobacillus acetoxydans]CAA7600775.1 Cobalamin (vitamin B12)-binding domain protein [Acididesulfobacillus acetoxydans]CEJ08623.1 Dimethylamine corrinoid protein 3 [Acididesulfobacillus acetoxydans]